MRTKKVIGMLIVIFMLATIIGVLVQTTTYAAQSSYVLGITNVREAQNGKQGGAYGIGGLKSDGTPTKKVWKIVSYETGTINYDNAFYCIKAEHGFGGFTTSTNVSDRKTYDTSFDMKTQSDEVITRLNAINRSIKKAEISQETYNKMMWIIDNMYLPKAEGSLETKQALMQAAGITEYGYGVLLTDDDIEVIQQLALWYFTNADDATYHKDNTDKTPKLSEILFNNWSGEDKTYKTFADWYDDPVENTREGITRQYQAEDLYKYFITNANLNANYTGEATTSPITLNKENVTATKNGNSHIVGPFEINAEQNRSYTISKLEFVDQNRNKIDLTGENKLLDENKQVVESGNIEDVLGQKFYISLPTNTKITNITFNIKATYNVTDATYYTTKDSTYLNEQPVVLVEKHPANYEDTVTVELPKPGTFDLSLRKFITKIGTTPITNRVPDPDLTDLKTGADETADYNHTKTPMSVKIGDIVTYTIRVYNEGQVDGYVEEITDKLPPELEFLPDDEENLTNGWYLDENDSSLRTIKTNHLSREMGEENLIKAFDGTTLSFKEVTVRCKVKDTAVSGQKITNIAYISAFVNGDGEAVTDRDSQATTFPQISDEELPTYKDDLINSKVPYIPGQQDDDDFEKIQIQVFDLALRKFITAVDSESITNRIPVPTMGVDGNIKYTHTKVPVEVQTNNIVTYTLRIFNEGDISGYASEITDNLPEGLLFLPDNDLNKIYRWKMIDKDGNETGDVTKAVKVTTDYLSKAQEKTEGSNLINAFNKQLGITNSNPDYKDIKIAFKVIEPNTSNRILTNIAQISDDSDEYGNPVDDVDSTPGNNVLTEDDIDIEHVKLAYFDLALRKFITAVNNDAVTTRIPVVTMGEDGNLKYTHTKEPVPVANSDIVTYTLRIFNEGTMDGYAAQITDNLPEGLLFLPDNELNKEYRWKMIDESGNETTDVTKAVKITTDYLSKQQEKSEGLNLIKAFDKDASISDSNPDHRDVKVAFKVIEPNGSKRILINTAEISDDTNKTGNPVDDIDSTPGNNKDGEDDIDIEKVKLKYFDLALRKFITAVDNDAVTNRVPVVTKGEDGNLKYTHTKEPVLVENGNIVTYTLRIFNEGEVSGYAKEITDNLPEGLLFLPENQLNKDYRWKMIDSEGKETQDVTKAVKITTDYLSKEQEKAPEGNLIFAFNKNANISDSNPDYKDVKVAFKVIEPNGSKRILINTAEISDDSGKDGNPTDDIDSTPGNNKDGEDDIDIEKVKLKYFDLALRKFITKVDNLDINNRIPVVTMGEDGNLKYTHTKEPVEVENGNIVIYTLRVYNEGEVAGYAKEVTDNLPQGLLFVPENDLNKEYRWKMIDKDGKETNEVTEAVKITTDYLSKEQEKNEGSNLINAFDKNADISETNPDYREVKVAFKVTEPNTSDRILINTAEISEDTDKNGNPTDDIDSTPGNNKDGEDDIDIEKVKVKYFDLALKKWVSQVIIIENGKQTVTPTGHTGNENPEPVVKVDLKDKKLNSVTVKFAYKVKVTNEGQIAGYVKELKDYIPAGLRFVAADNPDWKQVSDNVVATTKLENTLLKPGESASVDIILTWINGDNNLGKKVNIAEISKDYNDSHTPDIDSTPDNFKDGEDDIDDAPVILSIKTGEATIYFTLGIIMLVTVAGGIILIKKYVL